MNTTKQPNHVQKSGKKRQPKNQFMRIVYNYSTNIAGIPMPKNAIYGRFGDEYWYFDNYEQFRNEDKKYIEYYVMNEHDKKFYKEWLKRDNRFIQKVERFIKENGLLDTTCIYPLRLGKIEGTDESRLNFAKAKQAQSDFLFRPSNADTKHAITDYPCGKMPRWVSYR